MFARLLTVFYAIVSYAVFLVASLYAIGFVGNYVVPKSIDSGRPPNLGEAIGIICCYSAYSPSSTALWRARLSSDGGRASFRPPVSAAPTCCSPA